MPSLLPLMLDLAERLQVPVTFEAQGPGLWARVVRLRRRRNPQETGSYQILPSLSGWRVRVQVRPQLQEDERARVLLHELCHVLLHGRPLSGCAAYRTRELEAATCELLVLQGLGAPTARTVDYLDFWSDGGRHQLSADRRRHAQAAARRLLALAESAGIQPARA